MEVWASDVHTDDTKRQELINAVLISDKATTDVGFENAFATQILNFPSLYVQRQSDTVLTIYILQFSTYYLPPFSEESNHSWCLKKL